MPIDDVIKALSITTPLNLSGDIPNLGIGLEEAEEAQQIDRDPILRALIDSNALDPFTQSLLVDKDNRRMRRERLESQISELEGQLAGEEEGEGPIATLFGIPVGFQLGTFFGIKDPVARFVVDFLADPLLLLTGVGALTKVGRGLQFLTKAGKVLTPAEKATMLRASARVAGRSLVDPDVAKGIQQAVKVARETGDTTEAMTLFKKLSREIPKDTARAIEKIDPDLGALLRNDRKTLRGFRSAFEAIGKEERLEKAAGFLDSLAKGQRAVVSFGVPFTDLEFGALSFSKMAEALKSGRLKAAAKAAKGDVPSFFDEMFLQRSPHAEDALDLKSGSAIMEDLDRSVDGVLGTFRGEIPGGGGKTYTEAGGWFVSPQGVVRTFLTDRSSLAVWGSKIFSAGNKILKGLGEDIGERLTRIAAENVDLAADPRFQALPEHAQNYLLRVRKLLDETGEIAVDQEFMADIIAGYVPRLVEVKGNPAQRSMRAILNRIAAGKGVHGIDFDNVAAVRKGLEEGDTEQVIADLFKVLWSQKKRGLPGNKHTFSRVFETLEDLIKFSRENPDAFRVKTLQLPDLVNEYIRSFGDALLRNRTLNTLRKTTVEDHLLPELGRRAAFTAEDFADLAKKHPGVASRVSRVGSFVKVRNETFKGLMLHREVADQLKAVFETDLVRKLASEDTAGAKMVTALDRINSTFKATIFSLNPLFHATSMALFSGFAGLPPGTTFRALGQIARTTKDEIASVIRESTGFRDAIQRLVDPERMWDATLKTLSRTPAGANADDYIQRMARSGLRVGRTITGEEGFVSVERLLNGVIDSFSGSDFGRLLTSPLTGLKHFNVISDRFLWQNVQNVMKTTAWSHYIHADTLRWMKNFPGRVMDDATRFKIDVEAANRANAAFGNLAWDQLAVSPNMQRIARWAMIAPDWTLSNLMMARDMFVNIPGVKEAMRRVPLLSTADVLRDDRFRSALQYNMRWAFYTFAGASLANFAFTKYRTGDGKWLWENDQEAFDDKTGFKSRIELPWTRDDGRRQFMDPFRQYVEPWVLINNPPHFAKSKMGSLPRTFQMLIVGVDSFGNEISGTKDGPYGQIVRRFGELGLQFMPIVGQQLGRVARGELPPEALALSAAGFPIRSESLRGFERRERLLELKRALQEANSQ